MPLFVGIAAAKLVVLAVLGPSVQPDTELYLRFADAILDGSAFQPVAWGTQALPPLVFRLAGYPLLVAAVKLASPDHWAGLTIVVQGAASLAAMALVFQVARRLLGTTGRAALAVLLYAGSSLLLWDDALLSDSLYAALFNIVIFTLLGATLGCWRLTAPRLAGLALLWGYSLWVRDSGLYFSYLPLLALWLMPWPRPRRRLAAVGGFAAIVAAMVGAYCLFNQHRTGEAFFSITGTANYLRPLFDMRHYGYADPFTGSDPVSQAVREMRPGDDFYSQLGFLDALHQRCRCTPTELQTLVAGKLAAEATAHPLAYLRVVVRNINYFGLASDLADPVGTINQFAELGTPRGTGLIPGLSLRHLAALKADFSAGRLALMLVAGLSKAVSGVLFTLFLFGVPYLTWRACRRTRLSAELQSVAFLWFAFTSVSLAFSLIHYEARHALPLFPAAQIGIVYVAAALAARRRESAGLVQPG